MSAQPYILYGLPHSLYTGKARCYLRNQGIAYVERSIAHPDYRERIVPRIGRGIIPVLETPDGQIIQDTVDIIDHFEARGVPYPAYPAAPLQRVTAVLIEYYGSQAMLKHAMHYRWSYRAEQEAFLHEAFSAGAGPEFADGVMAKMNSYLPRLGVTEQSAPMIEQSFLELLDILERHFAVLPYLLGGHPTVADYGLIGPMFAHLGRDPVPAGLMKRRAPRVFRWVERMTAPGLDVVEYLDSRPELCPNDDLPPTLEPLLAHMALDMFPELDDKLAYLDRWFANQQPQNLAPVTERPSLRHLGVVSSSFHGAPIEVGVEPYLLFLLQRAGDTLTSLASDQAEQILQRLSQHGLDRAIPRGRSYRVERRENIEVWAVRAS